jgi:hypothetical protein
MTIFTRIAGYANPLIAAAPVVLARRVRVMQVCRPSAVGQKQGDTVSETLRMDVAAGLEGCRKE